jgi:hypothetical protein
MADLVHREVPELVRISRIWDFTVLRAKASRIVRGEGSVEDQIAGDVGMFGINAGV